MNMNDEQIMKDAGFTRLIDDAGLELVAQWEAKWKAQADKRNEEE